MTPFEKRLDRLGALIRYLVGHAEKVTRWINGEGSI